MYRDIKSIEITAQAKADEGTDTQVCSAFTLNKQQIKKLLIRSSEITVRTYMHDLDYAPCAVEGTLELANGLTGRWEIRMAGSARMEFEDKHIMLLFCRACGKPFIQ